MKKITQLTLFLFYSLNLFAQKQTYDLVTHTPPKSWMKEVKANTYTSYTINNTQKNEYCRIFIMASINSKGSIKEDFDSEWQNLVAKQYTGTTAPQETEESEKNGWKSKNGFTPFTSNNAKAVAMLTTLSGFNKTVSILVLTNTQTFDSNISQFMTSIEMKKPAAGNQNLQTVTTPATNSKFAFSTSNFDDGWTSTVQEDWVEVTKGNIKVLLHYPKEGTIFPADPDPLTRAAWNILVAPRYSSLRNFKTTYITTYERPYIGHGFATSNTTGKEMYVVLFRQGQSGWIEFIAPDKNSFIQNFKFDPDGIKWDSESSLMNPLLQMVNYNKFAIAASDFTGTWTSDFTGVQQLYSVYTGNYAGMNINQSKETFQFGAGNTYNWSILVVSGMVGSTKYANVKSAGKFTVLNNWQINFSDIEGKPKKYNAFFSCIKGARLLKLIDANYPGSGMYTIFGEK